MSAEWILHILDLHCLNERFMPAMGCLTILQGPAGGAEGFLESLRDVWEEWG